MDLLCYVFITFVFIILSCLFHVITCCERADLPLGYLVYDVFLCFCQFPIWCLGSGMVLD